MMTREDRFDKLPKEDLQKLAQESKQPTPAKQHEADQQAADAREALKGN